MSNINFTYKGLIVPVFTPFNNDEERTLNLSVIPDYARFLASKNINGVLVNGTTGEGTALNTEERKKVTEAWAAAVKETKQHLMIQIGGTSMNEVKQLAAHAELHGVDSLLCLPELYFKPNKLEDLGQYLSIISRYAPKTPLLYYHIPNLTMVKLNMGEFSWYLKKNPSKIPTFAGIKFTSNDLEEAMQFIKNNSKLSLFLGSDVLMAGGCTLGIDSFIMTTLNFIPEPALEILKYEKGNKNLLDTRKYQDMINKTVREVTRAGSWVETMKVAMNLTTDIFVGPPREPLKSLDKSAIETMEKGLKEIGLQINKDDFNKLIN